MLEVTVSPTLNEERMYDITLSNRTESKIHVISVCVYEESGHWVYWDYHCEEIQPQGSIPISYASTFTRLIILQVREVMER